MGRKFLVSVVFLGVLSLLSACGGGGDGGGGTAPATTTTTTLSGTIGSGYSAANLSNGVVDRIIAIPNFRGILNANSMTLAKTALIANDGSFSISLENDKNWVLILEDTRETDPTQRFVGFIALNAGSAGSLLSLPIAASNTTTMDLGTINQAGDTGVTNVVASTADFKLTSGALNTLASVDDYFRNVKNLVINYNGTTGSYILAMTTFEFRGIYNSMDNSYADPSDYSYRSYQVSLFPNIPGFTMSAVCGEGAAKVDIELYPPAGKSVTDRGGFIYNDTTPISNDFANCTSIDGFIEADEPSSQIINSSGDFYATDRTSSLGLPLTLEFGRGGGEGFTNSVPTGYWQYKVDGVLKGQFDLAVANPYMGGLINAVVPVMKINETAGVINSIDIKWYKPNATYTGYEEITDLTVLKQLIDLVSFELEDYSSGNRTDYWQYFFDPSTTTTNIVPSETWYLGGASGSPKASGIHISYVSGGVNLFFSNHYSSP